MRMLGWSINHRAIVVGLAIVVMATCVPLYHLVQQEYIPTNVDEGEFEMSVSAPEGASLAGMQSVLDRVYEELKVLPGVKHVVTIAGTGYLQQVNNSRVYVRLDDIENRVFSLTRLVQKTLQGKPAEAFRGIYSQRDVMQTIRDRLKGFPDLRVRVGNLQTINQGSAPYDIDFAIRGPDLVALNSYSEQVRAIAMKTPGLVDVDTTLRLNKPELHVEIDRERAADLGVDASDIAGSLRLMVGGDDEVSRFHDNQIAEEYDVEVRLQDVDRASQDVISKLYVPSSKSGMVRLDNVVQLKERTSAFRIEGLNRQRQVGIRANVAPGYALGDRLPEMFKAAESLNMPPAYSTTVIGRGR
jgi:HAE1 family hydrophobic/amphiphilic exporter-1